MLRPACAHPGPTAQQPGKKAEEVEWIAFAMAGVSPVSPIKLVSSPHENAITRMPLRKGTAEGYNQKP
jgi:hypothetical protein